MLKNLDPAKFPLRLEGDVLGKKLLPLAASVREGLSEIPTIEVDFFCENAKLKLEDIVGASVHLVAEDDKGSKERWFRGTCIMAEYVGQLDIGGQFRAVVRPWLWYLTRRTDVRIFQNMTAIDIIKKVIEDQGFSGRIDDKTSHKPATRVYCTQYRETDYAFISRLMEEEGIYYFFDYSGSIEKLVLADDTSAHAAIADPAELLYLPYNIKTTTEKIGGLVFEWNGAEQVRSAKVTLDDYDFENSTSDLKAESTKKDAKYIRSGDDRYDYPGRHRKADLGEHYAKVRMESEAAPRHMINGLSDAVTIAVGCTFKLKDGPRSDDDPSEVMVVSSEHELVQLAALEDGFFDGELAPMAALDIEKAHKEAHLARFRALKKDVQYRSPQITPWPNVGGIHTALVTGPSGEEIHTDKHGRIKVLFHWDRKGKKDENSSCWIRTMMPWTGKRWGAIAIPRIGQEVVIQFEEGDPDRPLCIGMLYNDKTMPPYELPANKTQSGVKTNSSLKGGGFNELMFEDKKDKELVRFQSERDYEQIVKNDATVTIGLEKKDPGDLSVTVHNDVSETINEGNYTELVKKGDHETTLDMGDHKTLLKQGDIEVEARAGKITVTAKQSIELKVGKSTIKMDPMSVTIQSPKIAVQADIKADLGSPLTTVKGDTMLTLKGGVVFIN
ncbi:MAG: type VI secretion system tip protein VgrG [Sulfitobacter sp.]|nr:type VI secretion system tip protein VgrG [Sulfitobacter sp.]